MVELVREKYRWSSVTWWSRHGRAECVLKLMTDCDEQTKSRACCVANQKERDFRDPSAGWNALQVVGNVLQQNGFVPYGRPEAVSTCTKVRVTCQTFDEIGQSLGRSGLGPPWKPQQTQESESVFLPRSNAKPQVLPSSRGMWWGRTRQKIPYPLCAQCAAGWSLRTSSAGGKGRNASGSSWSRKGEQKRWETLTWTWTCGWCERLITWATVRVRVTMYRQELDSARSCSVIVGSLWKWSCCHWCTHRAISPRNNGQF